MDLTKIIAVSGRPGLYEMQTQTRGGVVATSLVDGKRITTSLNSQISILSDTQIYCIGEEVPLTSIFEKMLVYESGAVTRVSPKSSAIELEGYFFEILENYDEDRVYPSDIKKIMQWYNLLLSKNLIAPPSSDEDKPTEDVNPLTETSSEK